MAHEVYTFDQVKESVEEALKALFPFSQQRQSGEQKIARTVTLNGLEFRDNKGADELYHQYDALVEKKKKGFAIPVYADLSLRTPQGEVQRAKIKILDLPKLTPRHTYIINGKETQLQSTLRRRGGIFITRNRPGQLRAEFNMPDRDIRPQKGRGVGLQIFFDDKTKQFKARLGGSNSAATVPAFDVLEALGYPVSSLRHDKELGGDVFSVNSLRKRGEQSLLPNLKKVYRKIYGEAAKDKLDKEDLQKQIREAFTAAKLDPDMTRITLGEEFPNVTADALVSSMKKLVRVSSGVEPEDDRDSLLFKHAILPPQRLAEAFTHDRSRKSLHREIVGRMSSGKQKDGENRSDDLRFIIPNGFLNKSIQQIFRSSEGESSEWSNPVGLASGANKISMLGTGALPNEESIPASTPLISPSHFGFIDPIHTPEAKRAGITLHLPIGTRFHGGELVAAMFKPDGSKVEVSAPHAAVKTIGFPDAYDFSSGKPVPRSKKVLAHKAGQLEEVDPSEVDYILPSSRNAFDIASNLTPSVQNNQGNRAMTASKQITQALPLHRDSREEPLVQTGMEAQIAEFAGARKAPQAGTITSIEEKPGTYEITLEAGKKKHRITAYRKFPLAGALLDSDLKVKVGEKVEEGQLLADSSFTKDGTLALGTNLMAAYIPWRGLTYEDASVISEKAAKKLTSVHLYEEELRLPKDKKKVLRERAAFFMRFRGKIGNQKYESALDKNGVIQIGQKIEPGQPLAVALKRIKPRPGDLSKLAKQAGIDPNFDPMILTWDKDLPGTVRDVREAEDGTLRILVETEEPMRVGDKLVGRHGNKSIVSSILPTGEMPHTKDGVPIDILLNPVGVPGRINLGQVIETATAKVAKKQGKPIIVEHFTNYSDMDKVEKLLKDAGIDPDAQEKLVDPTRGNRPFGDGVFAGPQYFYKLEHQVRTKSKARGGLRESYDKWGIPARGGEGGALSYGELGVYSLLSHGALKTLRDAQLYKSQKFPNDSLWTSILEGRPVPPPPHILPNERFEGLLRVAGVNLDKRGDHVRFLPQTDADTKALAKGNAIPHPEKLFRPTTQEDVVPEVGGLFDPQLTGFVPGKGGGTKWSYIKLEEPVPNAIYLDAISALTGWSRKKKKKVEDGEDGVEETGIDNPDENPEDAEVEVETGELYNVLSGRKAYKGLRGGAAVVARLKEVNLDDFEKETRKSIDKIQKSRSEPSKKAEKLLQPYKRLRYIQHLKQSNVRPEDAYMVSLLPVLPPMFRPISTISETTRVADDMSMLYRDTGLLNKILGDLKGYDIGDKHLAFAREAIYDATQAISQAEAKTKPLGGAYRGIVGTIGGKRPSKRGEVGEGPKGGLFQSEIVRRRQDFAARTTIIPDPQLHLDNIGLPFEMAYSIYRPWAQALLANKYGKGKEASKYYEEKGPTDQLVKRALIDVARDRPVLVKRDPALHKFNVMAFKPQLVDGKALKIHPLVTGGFGADFDGDCQFGTVLAYVSTDQILDKALIDALRAKKVDMAAYFNSALGLESEGFFAVFDLEDFPHTEELIGQKGHIDFYRVPEGIYVVAMDELNQQLICAPVSGYSVHRDREIEIVQLSSGRQIFTDDDPRAVYGVDCKTLQWSRATPSEAGDIFVPVVEEAPTLPLPHRVIVLPDSPRLNKTAVLDRDFGYFMGAVVGSGFTIDDTLFMVSSSPDVCSRWLESSRCVLQNPNDAFIGLNKARVVIRNEALAVWMDEQTGYGHHVKHLPSFALHAPLEFIQGLLEGLWDTNGSVSFSNGKEKPQFLCNYTSISLRLCREIQGILRTQGINSTISTARPVVHGPSWILNVSNVDLRMRLGSLCLAHPERQQKMNAFLEGEPPSSKGAYQKNKVVPITPELAELLCLRVREEAGPNIFRPDQTEKRARTLYTALRHAVQDGYMGKDTARDVITFVRTCDHPLFQRWSHLARATGYHFERVVSVEKTGRKETGYDLTVPGYETFMNVDGVILSNTMSVFTPVHPHAVKETEKLLPSNNLFSPATGSLMYQPGHEAVLGFYLMTKVGKPSNKRFKTLEEAESAYNKGTLDVTDQVRIGSEHTTLGWARVNNTLPAAFKVKKPLHERDQLGKDQINKLLFTIAKKAPQEFPNVVDQFKEIGNNYATDAGVSFKLSDFKVVDQPYRDRLFREADKEVAEGKKPVDAYGALIPRLDAHNKKVLRAQEKPNPIFQMVESGARANWTQLKQIVSAPVLVYDPQDRIVPRPIRTSFSEGLSLADYWTALHGARKGTIAKAVGTAQPGYLSKQMVRTSLDQLVTEDDCGTKQGIEMALDDPSLIGRFLAEGVRASTKGQRARTFNRNSLVTADVSSFLKTHQVDHVLVRSPLRCEAKQGVCKKCMGIMPDGDIPSMGTNVGVIAAQSIGEPSTQLSLKIFHTGGLVEDVNKPAESDRFERVEKLMRLPKTIKGSAILAPSTSHVVDIKKPKEGGLEVFLAGKKKPVHIPQPLVPKVFPHIKPGYVVKRGEALTSGLIHPLELMKLKGGYAAQRSLSEQLYNEFKDVKRVNKKHFEVLVKSMTDWTKVIHPKDSRWLPGQTVKLTDVKAYNQKVPKKERITHLPQFKGVGEAPTMTEDWLARLNADHLRDTLTRAISEGWESPTHGTHPIPPLTFIGDYPPRENTGFGVPPPGNVGPY